MMPAWLQWQSISHQYGQGSCTEAWAVESQRLENCQRRSTALPERVWGTAKGLLASFSGNILSHAKTGSNKFWRKLCSGLLCRGTHFVPLIWGGVQQMPEIALYLTKDEWGMCDYISVYEKNKQEQLTWERTWRKFMWKEKIG